jgi:hypothetical protein
VPAVRTTGLLDFVHHLEFYIQENTTFSKLDSFSSSGEVKEDIYIVESLKER